MKKTYQPSNKLYPTDIHKRALNGDIYLQKEILALKDKFQIKNVIETGTQFAFSTIWFSDNFDKVYTCDLVDDNVLNKHNKPNITFELQSSELFIQKHQSPNTLIYLDAHVYGKFTNINKELEIIDPSLKPIIVIHDYFVDNKLRYDVYPCGRLDYALISENLKKFNIGADYELKTNQHVYYGQVGVLFILPRNFAKYNEALIS